MINKEREVKKLRTGEGVECWRYYEIVESLEFQEY